MVFFSLYFLYLQKKFFEKNGWSFSPCILHEETFFKKIHQIVLTNSSFPYKYQQFNRDKK